MNHVQPMALGTPPFALLFLMHMLPVLDQQTRPGGRCRMLYPTSLFEKTQNDIFMYRGASSSGMGHLMVQLYHKEWISKHG